MTEPASLSNSEGNEATIRARITANMLEWAPSRYFGAFRADLAAFERMCDERAASRLSAIAPTPDLRARAEAYAASTSGEDKPAIAHDFEQGFVALMGALENIRKVAISYNGEYQALANPLARAVYVIANEAIVKGKNVHADTD